jgi:hypothetical protein
MGEDNLLSFNLAAEARKKVSAAFRNRMRPAGSLREPLGLDVVKSRIDAEAPSSAN